MLVVNVLNNAFKYPEYETTLTSDFPIAVVIDVLVPDKTETTGFVSTVRFVETVIILDTELPIVLVAVIDIVYVVFWERPVMV